MHCPPFPKELSFRNTSAVSLDCSEDFCSFLIPKVAEKMSSNICDSHINMNFWQEKGNGEVKTLRLIGDLSNNVAKIVKEVGCTCGKYQMIEQVCQLMMMKIYKLREERNSLKSQLKLLNGKEKIAKKESRPLPLKLLAVPANREQNTTVAPFKPKSGRQVPELRNSFPAKKPIEVYNFYQEQIPCEQQIQTSLDQTNLLDDSLSLLEQHQARPQPCFDTGQIGKAHQQPSHRQEKETNLMNLEKYIERIECARTFHNEQMRNHRSLLI